MAIIKKIIISLIFLQLQLITFSQNKVITYAPMGIVNKLRLKYEFKINDQFSSGTFFNLYYVTYAGPRLDPFIRIYPAGQAPKGLYLQGKAMLGYFSSNVNYSYIAGNDTINHKQQTNIPTYGAGIGIGYQFIFGRKKKPMDLFIGFQFLKYTGPQTIFVNNREYYTDYDFRWYITGPGSFLNANFGIGYSFN